MIWREVDRFCIGASSPYYSLVAKVGGDVIGDNLGRRPEFDPVEESARSRAFASLDHSFKGVLMPRRSTLSKSSTTQKSPRKGARRVRHPELPQQLQQVHLHAAGIDVGSEEHWVAVSADADPEPVRRFGAFTGELHRLADWLQQCGVETVVMESTGVYWIPLYELLQARGFEVWLVDARQLKNVPGRKTDVGDCQWAQTLHTFGLLSPAFRPADQFVVLRGYLRHRAMLVRSAAQHIQHMQKALQQMNVRLEKVLSDITGLTGMRIIDAILSGERDPLKLAQLRDERCRQDEVTIAAALEGNWRAEHLFALRQSLALYRTYQQQIAECDRETETYLATFPDQSGGQSPLPRKAKKKHRSAPQFDVRDSLFKVVGVDLTRIDGIDEQTALKLVGEIGTDMTRWPSVKHFASWLSLCPGNRISGGKSQSSRTRKSSNKAREILRQAVNGLHHSASALGAYLRRMKTKLGGPAGITAAAHKLAKIVYQVLSGAWKFEDQGATWYEQQFRERMLVSLTRKARDLGYQLVPNSPLQPTPTA